MDFYYKPIFTGILGWLNPWWLGSYGGKNWETSVFGFQPQREQIIFF